MRHALTTFPAALLVGASIACASEVVVERTGGPYVPTPQVVVDAMLEIAKVGPKDFVVDLGSGDGRIVLTAAQRYGARGLGLDIDPELVEGSNAEAKKRGLADKVTFRTQDVLKARLDDATVVTLYLLPGLMQHLQSKLAKELKPGTRVVSHDFPFNDWKPDRQVSVDVPEKYGATGNWKSTVYHWTVPAQVDGQWALNAAALGPVPLPLTFEQQYQALTGSLSTKAGRVALETPTVDGRRIAFRALLPSGPADFTGVVFERDRMQGEVAIGGRSARWSAERVTAPSGTAAR